MSISQNTQTEQYAVIAFTDLFGTGYRVQKCEYVAAAIAEGWTVIVNRCDLATAEHIATIYRTAGILETTANDLSDIGLEHDYQDVQENRVAESAQLFDTVFVPVYNPDECAAEELADMRGALWVEGVVTDITEDEIELDGYLTIDRKVAEKHGELICKAVADSGFVVEYNEFLDRLEQNKGRLYAVALQAETRLSSGMVA